MLLRKIPWLEALLPQDFAQLPKTMARGHVLHPQSGTAQLSGGLVVLGMFEVPVKAMT